MENVSPNGLIRRRWLTVVWLLLSQVIGLLPLLLWLVAAPFSLMAFDSGVSTDATLFVAAIWCYPVLPIGAVLGAWTLFAFKKDKAALFVTSLPLLVAVPLFGFIAYLWLSGG